MPIQFEHNGINIIINDEERTLCEVLDRMRR